MKSRIRIRIKEKKRILSADDADPQHRVLNIKIFHCEVLYRNDSRLKKKEYGFQIYLAVPMPYLGNGKLLLLSHAVLLRYDDVRQVLHIGVQLDGGVPGGPRLQHRPVVLHVVLDAVVDVRNLNRKIGFSKCCQLPTRFPGRSGKQKNSYDKIATNAFCKTYFLVSFVNGTLRQKPLNYIGIQ